MTKLSIQQRIQVGLILAIAFLLVLGSNRLDKKHFSTVHNTVNSVYKDRVVVQDLIYQLNNIFYEKELSFALESDFSVTTSENKKVEQLLLNFGSTKLTKNENHRLNELNTQFEKIRKLENQVLQSADNSKVGLAVVAIRTLDEMERNLDVLAEIQLEESNQLTELSNKSLDMNILLSNLEVAFLVIIGIFIIVLIFYPIGKGKSIQN